MPSPTLIISGKVEQGKRECKDEAGDKMANDSPLISVRISLSDSGQKKYADDRDKF
jgi:hypothetical protein